MNLITDNSRIEWLLDSDVSIQYQVWRDLLKVDMFTYPSRWRYDILRALDYFQSAGIGFDNRMTHALDVLISKRRSDKTWPLQARHNGLIHFDMEQPGKASRWNTLRALRVLKHFG